MRGLFGKVLREPLVHFLALGALIFAANALLHPRRETDDHRIEITQADVNRISALYAQQWGAPPREADMPSLVDNYVRSEVLFREGSALGLADDDSVLRNRIVQKMDFLLQDSASIPQPSDAAIAAWFKAHGDAYRVPEQIAFTQVYFSPSLRGDRAEADAKAALAALGSSSQVVGDPFMLGEDPSPRTRDAIAKDFGQPFADAVFAASGGAWIGPLRSTYGFHLVRILGRQPARLPALAEIRDRVHDDMMAERLHAATEAAYARIRAKYHVEIDPAASPPNGPLAGALE